MKRYIAKAISRLRYSDTLEALERCEAYTAKLDSILEAYKAGTVTSTKAVSLAAALEI